MIESDSEDEGEQEGDRPLTPSHRFSILRRHHGSRSRKRDKFSTTGLMKRVGEIVVVPHHEPTTSSIRDEFTKFVKRMSKSGESSESTSLNHQDRARYREPRYLFRDETALGRLFGRRRKPGRLVRSTSDSQSLGMHELTTSAESIPASIDSEPVFDFDSDLKCSLGVSETHDTTVVQINSTARYVSSMNALLVYDDIPSIPPLPASSPSLSLRRSALQVDSDCELSGFGYPTYPPLKAGGRTRTVTLVGSEDERQSSVSTTVSVLCRSPIPEELSSSKDKSDGSPPVAGEDTATVPVNASRSLPLPISTITPAESSSNGVAAPGGSSRSGSDSPDNKAAASTGSSCGPHTSISTSNASNVSGVGVGNKKGTPQVPTVLNRRSSESDLSTPPKGNPVVNAYY
jgi:hypothetical protein